MIYVITQTEEQHEFKDTTEIVNKYSETTIMMRIQRKQHIRI